MLERDDVLEVGEGVMGMVRLPCLAIPIQKKLYIADYFKVKRSSFFYLQGVFLLKSICEFFVNKYI